MAEVRDRDTIKTISPRAFRPSPLAASLTDSRGAFVWRLETMSKKSRAAQTADNATTQGAANDGVTADKTTRFADEVKGEGLEWNEGNTEPVSKTFHVEIRLDAGDRLKLGLLAARCGKTPERFLETRLRAWLNEIGDEVFGYGKKADAQLRETYHGLYLALLGKCLARGGGAARMVFKPAVMA